MAQDHKQHLTVVVGPEDTVRALEELQSEFARGEIRCAAFRLYKADGTWEDIALGGTDEEQRAALDSLREAHRNAH
jgi:hypothetical protein